MKHRINELAGIPRCATVFAHTPTANCVYVGMATIGKHETTISGFTHGTIDLETAKVLHEALGELIQWAEQETPRVVKR